ncbi:MAG: hypothetical protein K0R66_1724 [Gammaproteobacteria bacterium]|jgi:hypothetical protein|nr:hypothetical protein [Gammaproteobacteria bacterium]
MKKVMTYTRAQEIRERILDLWNEVKTDHPPTEIFIAFENLDAELLAWQDTL